MKPLFALCQEWRDLSDSLELDSADDAKYLGLCADALESRLREWAAEVNKPVREEFSLGPLYTMAVNADKEVIVRDILGVSPGGGTDGGN